MIIYLKLILIICISVIFLNSIYCNDTTISQKFTIICAFGPPFDGLKGLHKKNTLNIPDSLGYNRCSGWVSFFAKVDSSGNIFVVNIYNLMINDSTKLNENVLTYQNERVDSLYYDLKNKKYPPKINDICKWIESNLLKYKMEKNNCPNNHPFYYMLISLKIKFI